MKVGPVAIIIGVTEYDSSDLNQLPACLRDADAIEKIIIHTGRFAADNIFKLTGRVNSVQLKADLTAFFAARLGWNVDEVFFYFSGHGDYTANEFYYLLSDYDGNRLRQTSLEGSELDNLVRDLSPHLYVKIVDACHSGLRYIKSRDDFDAYVKRLSSSFSNLYFMFSSLSEQFSFGGKDLSRFTRYLVKSVKDTDKQKLRYKDVIDAVSDAMIAAGQTPYFITQAKFTETFCDVDDALKAELGRFITETPLATANSDKGESEGLFEVIRSDAERYATHDEAKSALQNFAQELTNAAPPKDLERFYVFESSTQSKSLSMFKGIGSWLEEEMTGEQFFAEPTYSTRTRTKRRPVSGFPAGVVPFGGKNYEEFEESYDVVNGFENTVDVPYIYFVVRAIERFPNVDPASCFVVPLISKTTMRVFWGWYFYDYIDWEKKKPRDQLEWQTSSIGIKEKTDKLAARIANEYYAFLQNALLQRWKNQPSVATPTQRE